MKKRIFKGIVTFLCVALGAVTLFGCSPLPEYEGDVVHYSSSDAGHRVCKELGNDEPRLA